MPLYCNNSAIHTAIVGALELHGLSPDPAAVTRRPKCADTLNHQLKRIVRSGAVLRTVRASVAVDEGSRRLIERLVDSASALIERDEVADCRVGLRSNATAAHSSVSPRLIESKRAKAKTVRA